MLDSITPALLITRLLVLVGAFTIHEFAHAFTADRFGDDTPRQQGRLTLNPLVHLDPIGTLLLLVAGFGWAKPVQVNPYALERRSPAAPMLVALAGPAANLLLAVIAAIPLRFEWVAPILQQTQWLPTAFDVLSGFVLIDLILMLFNLIPIFPLDGEKVLMYFLPPSGQAFLESMRQYGWLMLLALIFFLPSFGVDLLSDLVLGPAVNIGRFLIMGA